MVRPCCEKVDVKRGLWTAEEDAKMLAYVSKHGIGDWTTVPKKAGLRRCGKSCRLRWTNYLRPDLKHENFTPQEEEMIIRLHAAIGSRWSIIAQQLPGRTDNDVKNYWNTKLRKRLSEMGIDPVTHKPFSQILADYGNIGGLPRSANRFGSVNRDLKNALALKSEQSPNLDSIQDIFLSFQNFNYPNKPLDLHGHIQAIKFVNEASNWTTHETNPPILCNDSCSSSRSSSSSSNPNQESFSWRDFLVEEEFLPGKNTEDQENFVGFSPKGCSSQIENEILGDGTKEEENSGLHAVEEIKDNFQINSYQASSSSSSDSSFVEAILDQQNDMLLEFPNLFEEPNFY